MATNDSVQRQILPIPDRKPIGLTTYDAKDPDTKFPPITPLRPPKGAPNVLIILIDDVGFGASSAFGGPCPSRAGSVSHRYKSANRKSAERLHFDRHCEETATLRRHFS